MRVGKLGVAVVIGLMGCLVFDYAHAAMEASESGLVEQIMTRFLNSSETWEPTLYDHASYIFWFLVTVTMVYRFGMLAIQRADAQSFFSEALRFIIITGIFFALLVHGTNIGDAIIKSLRALGAKAVNSSAGGLSVDGDGLLDPQDIFDMGFKILVEAANAFELYNPFVGLVTILMAVAILVLCVIIGMNVFLLSLAAQLVVFAGMIVLGFGGSSLTSEIAMNYFRSCLAIGLKLMVLVLLIGVGLNFGNELVDAAKEDALTFKETAVLLTAFLLLFGLAQELPNMIANIVLYSTTGAAIGNHGTGAALAMGGATVATAGLAWNAARGAGRTIGGGIATVAQAVRSGRGGAAQDGGAMAQSTGDGGASQTTRGTDPGMSPLAAASTQSGQTKTGSRDAVGFGFSGLAAMLAGGTGGAREPGDLENGRRSQEVKARRKGG